MLSFTRIQNKNAIYFKGKKEKLERRKTQLVCLQGKKIASPSGPAKHKIVEAVEQHKVGAVGTATGNVPALARGKSLENQTSLRNA